MTRTEKALLMAWPGEVPPYFVHSVTPGKPTEPSVGFLGAEDLQRYTIWKAQRESGALPGDAKLNAGSALLTAMANYESWATSPVYIAWANTEVATRVMQWRLTLVDVSEAVNAAATVPPSFDSGGVGTPAPSVPDIGAIGKPPVSTTPAYVTTGDKFTPELVFGDDGDIVTVS